MIDMGLPHVMAARSEGPEIMNLPERGASDQDYVMISYRGAITGELISRILTFVESRFTDLRATPSVRRKLVSVLVETLQNIYHHADPGLTVQDIMGTEDDSTVMICQKDKDYVVLTGNRIRSSQAELLKERIQRINAMTKEELNSSYRNILMLKQKSSSTGAGVGFIDIVRRSGQKIEFSMQKVDEDHYFFSMQVRIAH